MIDLMLWRRRRRRKAVVYSRKPCPLCDEAIALLHRYGLDVTVVDVDENPMLAREYGDEVPVVFMDGKKRFFGRVDPVLLRRLLSTR